MFEVSAKYVCIKDTQLQKKKISGISSVDRIVSIRRNSRYQPAVCYAQTRLQHPDPFLYLRTLALHLSIQTKIPSLPYSHEDALRVSSHYHPRERTRVGPQAFYLAPVRRSQRPPAVLAPGAFSGERTVVFHAALPSTKSW